MTKDKFKADSNERPKLETSDIQENNSDIQQQNVVIKEKELDPAIVERANSYITNHNNDYLTKAIENKDIEVVKYLIEECEADVHDKSASRSNTVLMSAVESDDIDIIKYLIEKHGADVHAKNNIGDTALIYTALSGNIDIAKYLIEKHGADVNNINNIGDTVLILAEGLGHIYLVKYLIEEYKLDVNTIDEGHTLAIAVESGDVDLVKYFVEEHKFDANAKNKHGQTPLITAVHMLDAEKGNMDIIQYLLEYSANIDVQNENSNISSNLFLNNCNKVLDYIHLVQISKPELVNSTILAYKLAHKSDTDLPSLEDTVDPIIFMNKYKEALLKFGVQTNTVIDL
jgi:ankyrin repeat protein